MSGNRSRALLISAFLIVAAGVIGFALYYPPGEEEDVAGTIGGVERAQRHRGEQLSGEDIILASDEFNQFIQSAEWQNLSRNEDFIRAAETGELDRFLASARETQIWTTLFATTQIAVAKDLQGEELYAEEIIPLVEEHLILGGEHLDELRREAIARSITEEAVEIAESIE